MIFMNSLPIAVAAAAGVRRAQAKKHATMVVRPSGSHDRAGGGERGAAQIASGCVCACPDWCAEGAACRHKANGAHRHLQLLNLAVDLACVVRLRPLLVMPFPAARASAERKGGVVMLEKARWRRAGGAGSCWRVWWRWVCPSAGDAARENCVASWERPWELLRVSIDTALFSDHTSASTSTYIIHLWLGSVSG